VNTLRPLRALAIPALVAVATTRLAVLLVILVLAVLVLWAAVVFARSDAPARRSAELLSALRSPRNDHAGRRTRGRVAP
jgi:hypothetical protein